jgi:hypothetical protein
MTMTIKFNYIPGRAHSACNNDAWAIVEDGRDILGIIPVSELGGRSLQEITPQFLASALMAENKGLPGKIVPVYSSPAP